MSKHPKILVTQRIHEEVQQRLSAYGELDMNSSPDPWPQAEVMRRAPQGSALMGFMTGPIHTGLLLCRPQIKIWAFAAQGF